MLEYLSVSGLQADRRRAAVRRRDAGRARRQRAARATSGETSSITAVNGIPVAGHQGPGSIADTTVRKLLMLQGLARPRRIVSLMSYPGAAGAVTSPRAADAIRVAFAAPRRQRARTPRACSTRRWRRSEWIKLIARLGEIPDPTVASGPSSAAIPDAAGDRRERGRRKPVATTSPPSPPAPPPPPPPSPPAPAPRARARARAPAASSPSARSRSSC